MEFHEFHGLGGETAEFRRIGGGPQDAGASWRARSIAIGRSVRRQPVRTTREGNMETDAVARWLRCASGYVVSRDVLSVSTAHRDAVAL